MDAYLIQGFVNIAMGYIVGLLLFIALCIVLIFTEGKTDGHP